MGSISSAIGQTGAPVGGNRAVAPLGGRAPGAFEALGIERRLLPSRLYRGAAGNTRRYLDAGTLRRRGARRARAVPPRPPNEVRARLQVLGSADSSGREAHQSRTGLVPGRDAQGGEREGAGEQAVDPLGPRPESRESSHLRGGRREGDGDPLADLEGPLPHRRAVAADAAGLHISAHRPEARERGRDGRRARHPQAHLVKQARSGEGRTSADRRGDEVGRREGLPVGQPGG